MESLMEVLAPRAWLVFLAFIVAIYGGIFWFLTRDEGRRKK